ncbi:hypothetical protein [Xanthomonas arboricola]|uniref:hypothetical protein n=1 Tax=Xanthomonas arboricola TaxID=56448 RepID=UPI003EB929D0
MAWVGIAEAGVEFSLEPSPYAEITGSVISSQPSAGGYVFYTGGAQEFRLSFLSYQSQAVVGDEAPSAIRYSDDDSGSTVTISNESGSGTVGSFSPNPVEFSNSSRWEYRPGYGSETYRQDTAQLLVEVWQQGPEPPQPAGCDEIGRVSRAFVSAHTRTRVRGVHVGAGERRCVVADYNGAIPPSRSIARVEWRLAGDGVARIFEAAIPTTRQTQVQLHAQRAGRVMLRCLATLDNGEVYVQSFMVLVAPDPFADQAGAGGSLVLTAVAP